MTDDYYAWAARSTRPREEVRKELDPLESTQPIEVLEHKVSDTGVTRIREAITRHKRGERS